MFPSNFRLSFVTTRFTLAGSTSSSSGHAYRINSSRLIGELIWRNKRSRNRYSRLDKGTRLAPSTNSRRDESSREPECSESLTGGGNEILRNASIRSRSSSNEYGWLKHASAPARSILTRSAAQ